MTAPLTRFTKPVDDDYDEDEECEIENDRADMERDCELRPFADD